MTDTRDPADSVASSDFTLFAAGLRPGMSSLAYLLIGHHATAGDAVAGALRETAASWTGPGPAVVDACWLSLVRHSLVLADVPDRVEDDDFWRTGVWVLQRLPADQRLIVALAAVPGLDEAATAQLLGVPVRVVRRRFRAACASLGRQMKIPEVDGPQAVVEALVAVAATHPVGTASVQPPVGDAVQPAGSADAGAVRRVGPVQAGDRYRAAAAAAARSVAAGLAGAGLSAVSRREGVTRGGGVAHLAVAARFAAGAVVLALVGGSVYWMLSAEIGRENTSVATPATRPSSVLPTIPTPPPGGVPTPPAPGDTTATGPPIAPPTTEVPTAPRTADNTPRATSSRRTTPPTTTRPTTRTPTRVPTALPPVLPEGLIVGRASERCFEVPTGPARGLPVRLGDCVGGDGQTVVDGPGGSLLLAGLCVDVFGWGADPGTPIVVWDCTGGVNQQWILGGDGTIRSVFVPSLCVAAEGGGRAVGTRLVLQACGGGPSQVWGRT